MRLRLSILGASIALASLLGTSVALADGYSPSRGGYARHPMMSWTGFYVGAHLGGAWCDVEWASVTFTGERVANHANGFFGGAEMGSNQQLGNIVLGLEA